jgi:hypothetical protein
MGCQLSAISCQLFRLKNNKRSRRLQPAPLCLVIKQRRIFKPRGDHKKADS